MKGKKIFLYSWLPTGAYHNKLVIWEKKIQNLANVGHFFHEK